MTITLDENKEWDWIIYKIINPNGAVYVGKTRNFKSRMMNYSNGHGNTFKQPLIYNSLQKYGFDSHEVKILEQFRGNLDVVDSKEIFWIRTNMCNLSKWRDMNGLNLTDGGDGTRGAKYKRKSSPFKGRKLSDEARKRISDAAKATGRCPMAGKKHSEYSKKKMSDTKKGMVSLFLGCTHSEESRLKISIGNKGKVSPFKGVSIWDDENRKRIGESKRGNTNNLGKTYSEEIKQKMRDAKIAKSKIVLQYDLHNNFINEFQSMRMAAKETGMSRNSICEILSGETKNPKRFIFKYKTEC